MSDESGSDTDGSFEIQDDNAIPLSYWVKISAIKTLKELYQEGVLTGKASTSKDAAAAGTPTDNPSYTHNPAFLDRVSLYQGDITKLEIDSIVNAANKTLLGGGGVDGAIHARAGPKLLEECRQLNGALTGQSKITLGYDLPASHVIHTVGPVYGRTDNEDKPHQLASCYRTSLQLAVDNQLRHIAFPSISTGIYGYPIVDATHIALKTARDFLEEAQADKIERVIFVVWSDKDKETYQDLIPKYFPPAESADSAATGSTGEAASS